VLAEVVVAVRAAPDSDPFRAGVAEAVDAGGVPVDPGLAAAVLADVREAHTQVGWLPNLPGRPPAAPCPRCRGRASVELQREGGHTEYTVSKVGGQTVVSFVACDDRPDGYGVVVLTYSGGHGLGVFTTDRNGSGNGCEERKRKSVTLRESISSVSLKVCLHDQNRNKDKSGLRKACRQTKTIS
jgi:hypothetical protein